MGCIIDAIENSVYGDPCAGKEPVDETHRVIETNIEGNSIQEKIEKAQVVILLEQHFSQNIQHLNGRVIRQMSKKGEIVLYEGVRSPDYLPYTIRSAAKSWDLPQSEQNIKIYKEWGQVIEDVAFVLPLYLALTLSATSKDLRNCDEGIRILLKDFYPSNGEEKFKSFQKMGKEERVAFLKVMSQECLTQIQNYEKRYHSLFDTEFYKRNVHLAEKTEEALKVNSKVWVIAGEAHGRYMRSADLQGVDHLYQSLEAKKTHYVTLKCFDPTLESDEYSNDKSKVHLREEKFNREVAKGKQEDREAFLQQIPCNDPPIIQLGKIQKFIDECQGQDIRIVSEYAEWILERIIEWK